jgi:hypothetical protein
MNFNVCLAHLFNPIPVSMVFSYGPLLSNYPIFDTSKKTSGEFNEFGTSCQAVVKGISDKATKVTK